MATVTINVNGVNRTATVSSTGMPLLWFLRDVLGLTGTKYGCGIEICGACSVLVNGQREKSCDMSVAEAVGRQITTVEGLANDTQGSKAQAAWIANQVPQCGYCQPGMLISCTSSMKSGGKGSVPNNICQCGTYQRIKNAVKTL